MKDLVLWSDVVQIMHWQTGMIVSVFLCMRILTGESTELHPNMEKTPKEAKDMITKTDKSRASYYNYYTNKKWGAARSYNLCIDSSKLGIDYAIEAIIESIKIFDRTKISK